MHFVSAARAAKIAAIVCFFLPWLAVSCSGHTLGTATGMDLTLGHLTLHDPSSGLAETRHVPFNPFLALSIFLIVVGAFLGQSRKSDQTSRHILAMSILAMVLIVVGVPLSRELGRKAIASNGAGPFAHAADGLFTIETRYGYYLVLVCLATASGISLLNLRPGSRSALLSNLGSLSALAQGESSQNASDDLLFWDSMRSKDDPDLLREYLIRYPGGRLAPIAGDKLRRAGYDTSEYDQRRASLARDPQRVVVAESPISTPTILGGLPARQTTSPRCDVCGTIWDTAARFCTNCGHARGPETVPGEAPS